MPTLAQTELNSLIEPVKRYSQEAVQKLIYAARDPEVAEQVALYLDNHFNGDGLHDFTEIGICVALGEAHAENAIPALLRAATYQKIDTGIYGEAALYAMQHMGRPAFDAAMQFIQGDDPTLGARTSLQRFAGRGRRRRATRRDVADFCFSRLREEVDKEWEDEWHLGVSCCEVLVMLRDQRVRPILEEVAEQSSALLRNLADDKEPRVEDEWRMPWPDQCMEWSGYLKDDDGEDDEDESEEIRLQYNQSLSSLREEKGPEDAFYEPSKPIRRESPKVGRNDPCPCGSGKKFKKCCGK